MFKQHFYITRPRLLPIALFGLLLFTECRGQQPEKPKAGDQPPTAQPSVPAPAQMETGPGIQLVPVDFKEVFPFYIRQNIRGDSIVLYEDGRLTHVKLQEGEWAAISKNEQYFTIYKNLPVKQQYFGNKNLPTVGKKFDYSRYEVEVRNIENKVIGKGIVDAVGSYEGPDVIYPFDDGKRICISGGYTDQPWFAIYRAKPSGDGFTEDFRFIGPDDVNRVGGFMVCEAQERVITTYEDYRGDTLMIRCYNLKGNLLWKKIMRDCIVDGPMFISEFDGSVAFPKVSGKANRIDKVPTYEVVLNPKGQLLHEFEIKYTSTDHDSYFVLENGNQYFIHSDGGRNIHIYDFNNDVLITKSYDDFSLKKIYERKEGVLFDGNQLIYTAYTLNYNLMVDGLPIMSDRKIVVEDIKTSRIKEVPAPVAGSPGLVKKGGKIYLVNRDIINNSLKNEPYYKILIKQ